MNTSVGDLIEINQLLMSYFMEKELQAPKTSEISIQTIEEAPKTEENSEEGSKESSEQKGQRVMLITACRHTTRKHYAKVSPFFAKSSS